MGAVAASTPPPDGLAGLNAAAARVGDRWTLVIVAALLEGPRRYGELQEALPGVATNVLSKRLKLLEAEGLVVASAYSRRPTRFAYQLTATGAALTDALRLLAQWGADHPAAGVDGGPAEATEPLRHAACGTPVEARWWCATCGRQVEPAEASDTRWA